MCKSTNVPQRSTFIRQITHNSDIFDDDASTNSIDSATTNINILNELPRLLPYVGDDDSSVSSSDNDSDDSSDGPPPLIPRSYVDDSEDDISTNNGGDDDNEVERQQRLPPSNNFRIELNFINEMRRLLDDVRLVDVQFQLETNPLNRLNAHLDSQTNRHLNDRMRRVRSQFIVDEIISETTTHE